MTIRKYLGLTGQPSKLPNARKLIREGENQETWAIPLSDLYEAGLMKAKITSTPQPEKYDPLDPINSLILKAENEALKKEIARLEAHLADLQEEVRFSRRAIETKEDQEKRRRFWQR